MFMYVECTQEFLCTRYTRTRCTVYLIYVVYEYVRKSIRRLDLVYIVLVVLCYTRPNTLVCVELDYSAIVVYS